MLVFRIYVKKRHFLFNLYVMDKLIQFLLHDQLKISHVYKIQSNNMIEHFFAFLFPSKITKKKSF